MGSDEETAPPPPYTPGQGEDTQVPDEKSILKMIQRTSINPEGVSSNNPVLIARFVGQKYDDLKLIIGTRISLEAHSIKHQRRLWKVHSRDYRVMQDTDIPVQFSPYVVASPGGSRLSVLVNRDADPRYIVMDAETGNVGFRFSLNEECGDFSCLSGDGHKFSAIHWREKGNNWISVVPFKAFNLPEGEVEKSNTFWSNRLPKGRIITMAFAPDGNHLITCEGPDVTATEGSSRLSIGGGSSSSSLTNSGRDARSDLRAQDSMGREADLKKRRDAAAKVKSNTKLTIDYTVEIKVTKWSDATCVRHLTFPGRAGGAMDMFQRPLFSPQFHFADKDRWMLSFPDYASSSGDLRVVDTGTGVTLSTISAKNSMAQKLRAAAPPTLGYDHESGYWTKVEEKTSMMTKSKKQLVVTRWREERVGLEKVAPATQTTQLGPNESYMLSAGGDWIAIQRADGVSIDLMALDW